MAGFLAGSSAAAEDPDRLPSGNIEDALAKAFAAPPNESKPWCYWWWLNGAASKEGITRDFEEMRKQGISGALLFDAGEAGPEAPRGPKFMSAEWRELYRHAVREADRCGIALGVNLCSGWNAGGPWVTPEHAAKKLVAAQTSRQRAGPRQCRAPETGRRCRASTATSPCWPRRWWAERWPAAQLRASSQYQNYAPALAEDGDEESRWISNGDKPGMGPTPEKPEFLQFDFAEPWTAAGLFLKPYSDCGPKDIEVQCSDDGQMFRPLKRLTLQPRDERDRRLR